MCLFSVRFLSDKWGAGMNTLNSGIIIIIIIYTIYVKDTARYRWYTFQNCISFRRTTLNLIKYYFDTWVKNVVTRSFGSEQRGFWHDVLQRGIDETRKSRHKAKICHVFHFEDYTTTTRRHRCGPTAAKMMMMTPSYLCVQCCMVNAAIAVVAAAVVNGIINMI